MNKFLILGMLLVAQAAFSQNYAASDIPEPLKKNALAVIREDSEIRTLNSINDMKIQSKYAVTILDKSGNDYALVTIPYNPTTKISGIKINLYDASGKLIKSYSKKDFSDYTYNRSGALYVDDRILVLNPSSNTYPFTVETMYETNTSNTIYLNSFSPFHSFGVSLQKADYKIINKSGITIRTKIKDNDFGKVQIAESGDTRDYRYENIPAIRLQDYSPSIDYLVPRVDFTPEHFTLAGKAGDLSSWDNFGKWYYNQLLKPVSEISPEIKQEIAALNLSGSTEEKVKKIYQYMQNKTRYVLISMGIGGWMPMEATDVSQKGYGDCKALTNYMRTLLAAAGINSYFSIIYDSRTEQRFDKDFPELNGNHAILIIPTENGNIWLENTSQKIAFNHLSYTSHNRNVLAINENGLQIIDTPVYKPEESKEIMNAKVVLNDDSSITSQASFLYTGGQYDYSLGLIGLKSDELQTLMKDNYYGLKIGDITVDHLNNDRDKAEISYELNLKANNFSKKLGEDIFFPVMPFGKTSMVSIHEERDLPFETPFPYQDDYTIEYSVPAGFKFSEIPPSVDFKSEFGAYTMNFEHRDNKLIVHRILTINKGIYPKDKFKDFADFKKKAANIDNTKILITKL